MTGRLELSPHTGVALDLILKTLIASQDFSNVEDKGWEALSRLIPGTTPGQVARRYEELLLSGDILALNQLDRNISLLSGGNNGSGMGQGSLSESEASSKSGASRPGSARQKGSKDEKEVLENKDDKDMREIADHGPMMVIHVCDEAKKLKQDFQCPRDLLIQEMKYFAEYLSTDAQRWEEVDISVHCDVQIFDWLMNYVKRGFNQGKPKLEPSNVISILISSDFLKMDALVQEGIEYCHANMSAIVATPCNMNCINDKLLSRISDLFSHNEADDIKDRKDKFKNKLFAKKVEKLFDPEMINPDSPENASTLFRCSICKRLLTKTVERKVKCLPSRMTVDKRGKLTYAHVLEPAFEVNDYLIELKTQYKTWREVYWKIWGTINYLTCSRCGEIFQCCEFGHCKFHPEAPRYDNEGTNQQSYIGSYPCCHQKALRFDPTQQNKGCRVRDHIISLTEDLSSSDPDLQKPRPNKVYDDLLAHRDVICVPYQGLTDASEQELNVFSNQEFACDSRKQGVAIPANLLRAEEDHGKLESARPKPRLQALTIEREVSFDYDDIGMGESDDEVGDDEMPTKGTGRKMRGLKKSRVTIAPQAILLDAPEFEQTKKSTWDTARSMRYNQDAQRQEDQRRMKEIRMYLSKLRLNADKIDKPKKEYPGGIYSKLEAQFRANCIQQQQLKQPAVGQFRPKPRPIQPRPSLS